MEFTPTQELLLTAIVPIAVLIIMFSLGLSLTLKDFQRVITEPKLFLIPLLGQYLLMPALAIAFIWILDVPAYIALGALIVASVPGGTVSNGFVYIGRGNVALSVSLTAVSQIVGLISIPLWVTWGLSFYYAEVADVEFPVLQSLALVFFVNIVPMAIGMLVNHFAPKATERLEPILRRASMILLFAIIIVAILPNFEVAIQEGARAAVLATVLCSLGVIIGNLVSRAVGLPWQDAFTNGIEIGIQNLATAILIGATILGRSELAIYAAVYSVISPLVALISVGIFSRQKNTDETTALN